MKKIELIESELVLEAGYGGDYTAYAAKNPLDWDGENVTGGDYRIDFQQSAMPPFSTLRFAESGQLLAAMRDIAPLSHWRISLE